MTDHSTSKRRELALSASRANDYQRCPLLFRFRTIDRLAEPKTRAQVRGTVVHAVLEQLHSLERPERTFARAVKTIRPCWEQLLEQEPELAELIPAAETEQFFIEARELIRGYFLMENPQGFDAAGIEHYVDLHLPSGIPVRGFIDRIDIAPTGEIRIVDYKTGRKPPARFGTEAQFQMRFYALLYWRLSGSLPTQLRLMYLSSSEDLVLSPDAQDLEFFEAELVELWERIRRDGHSGIFRPRESRLCDWCAFWQLCPAKGGVPPEYPGWPGP